MGTGIVRVQNQDAGWTMNTWKGLWVGTLVLCCAVSAHAAGVFRVDAASAAATPDGQSWAAAYKTLQAAVDAAYAASGGEVWVKTGTYTATTDPVLTMKSGVSIYGGFAGTESARDQRNWSANITTIDGEKARSCVAGANAAVLDGFTVTRGSRSGSSGGGMLNSHASPTVTNCIFTGNSAGGYGDSGGGGMYNAYSSPTLVNCTFSNNLAHHTEIWANYNYGGGMYNTSSSPTLTGCTFSGNIAGHGGGMYNSSSSPTLTNCVFASNSVT